MNAERGEVAIGDIALRFTTNRLCIAETVGKVRMPVLLLNAEWAKGFSVDEVRLLIFAGRVDPPADWSLEAAGAFIDDHGFTPCAIAVRAAIMAAFPPAEGDNAGEG